MEEEKATLISKTVFGFTLVVVILSLVGLIFPALLTAILFPVALFVNPFEFARQAICLRGITPRQHRFGSGS